MRLFSPNRYPLIPKQQGFGAISLLIIIVFGVFILWEINEFIGIQVLPPPQASPKPGTEASGSATLCLTGEAGNCNDSNDAFILD